jgi:hypothetical protein
LVTAEALILNGKRSTRRRIIIETGGVGITLFEPLCGLLLKYRWEHPRGKTDVYFQTSYNCSYLSFFVSPAISGSHLTGFWLYHGHGGSAI